MVDSFPPAPNPEPKPPVSSGVTGQASASRAPGAPGASLNQQPAASPPELLLVGRLVAAQGLGGELRVLPLSDFPERFTHPGPRWLKARGQAAVPVRLRSGRQLPGRELFVVRLEGIDNRSAAEALVGQELMVPAGDRPPLAPGEFHLLDLVGLEVRLLGGGRPPVENVTPTQASQDRDRIAGEAAEGSQADDPGKTTTDVSTGDSATVVIGRVLDLIHAGNDLLEVELNAAVPDGPRHQVFIPFVDAIVPEVNLAEGWIGITPPPGLLEL